MIVNRFYRLVLASSILLVLMGLAPEPAVAASAEEGVARIQKAYEGVKDLKGDFTQKSTVKELKRTDMYKGEFAIKSPMMKWEYTGDKPQVIYVTGDNIIVYQKMEKQAFKAKFDRATYGQAPIALLGGFGRITEEFDASWKHSKLILTPKKPMGNVVRIEISLSDSPFPIESLTVIDRLSNSIEIRLRNVKTNTAVKDKVFEFMPPQGVTVIEQE
jgi:outer membrane lipoprotein carrier protein